MVRSNGYNDNERSDSPPPSRPIMGDDFLEEDIEYMPEDEEIEEDVEKDRLLSLLKNQALKESTVTVSTPVRREKAPRKRKEVVVEKKEVVVEPSNAHVTEQKQVQEKQVQQPAESSASISSLLEELDGLCK